MSDKPKLSEAFRTGNIFATADAAERMQREIAELKERVDYLWDFRTGANQLAALTERVDALRHDYGKHHAALTVRVAALEKAIAGIVKAQELINEGVKTILNLQDKPAPAPAEEPRPITGQEWWDAMEGEPIPAAQEGGIRVYQRTVDGMTVWVERAIPKRGENVEIRYGWLYPDPEVKKP